MSLRRLSLHNLRIWHESRFSQRHASDVNHYNRVELMSHDQVIDYLAKKGYHETEETLKREAARQEIMDKVLVQYPQDRSAQKYFEGYRLLTGWIEGLMDYQRFDLHRIKWPIFVQCLLNLVQEGHSELADQFFETFKSSIPDQHSTELNALKFVRLPEHIESNETAQIYRKDNNKYRLTFPEHTNYVLMMFLEEKLTSGGGVILQIISNCIDLKPTSRVKSQNPAITALLARVGLADVQDEEEGILGHHPGSANTHPDAPRVLERLHLGPLPMDAELMEDVRGDLEDEDTVNPPKPGNVTLVEEFDEKVRLASLQDQPSRDAVPLPKPLARDVDAEVLRIKEHRDRFRIPPQAPGAGAKDLGLSVPMFTFHNTHDSVICVAFSPDQELIAVGTENSFARVWTVSGESLPCRLNMDLESSRKLIGHSDRIFALSFSPVPSPLPENLVRHKEDGSIPGSTSEGPPKHHLLLSCSADRKIRLWSCHLWITLVVYTGHTRPVYDVAWHPHGHYFASCSSDRMAMLWSMDRAGPLRFFVGHDGSVEKLAWHPNGTYLFTASNDKTVRMWDVSRGEAVRMYTGHTSPITAIRSSPTGKVLASADDKGTIFLWNLENGKRINVLRGHGRGGVWALTWSVEGTVVASCGADGTVRAWNPIPLNASAESGGIGSGAQPGSGKGDGKDVKKSATVGPGVAAGGNLGGKKEDAKVSHEQIAVYQTKQSPVYQVEFTAMNLLLAAGAFLPGVL